MAEFRKYLIISAESSRLAREEFVLDRVAWENIERIENLSDYDIVVINLTALREKGQTKVFEASDIAKVFDPQSWTHILSSSGHIFIVGDPNFTITIVDTPEEQRRKMREDQIAETAKLAGPVIGSSHLVSAPKQRSTLHQANPLESLLDVAMDRRRFEYRRITRDNEGRYKVIFKYMDNVSDWSYSVSGFSPTPSWDPSLNESDIRLRYSAIGITSYKTALSVRFESSGGNSVGASVTLLPPLGQGADAEDVFILKEFLGIATNLPEPNWVQSLVLPGQARIENEIKSKREARTRIEREISDGEGQLTECKRWYRLLYDDGHSLETIVKEAIELLGASVAKTSKVKDDFRVKISRFPEGVMEVKGTHNPRFAIGALRQLAGWMDEANARENIMVKGIFVGNSARNDAPATRGTLFEKNNEDYAVIKDVVIVRAMDLFCLTILKLLNLLDVTSFWKELFACKGAFDASKYWAMLPKEFQIPSPNVPSASRK